MKVMFRFAKTFNCGVFSLCILYIALLSRDEVNINLYMEHGTPIVHIAFDCEAVGY